MPSISVRERDLGGRSGKPQEKVAPRSACTPGSHISGFGEFGKSGANQGAVDRGADQPDADRGAGVVIFARGSTPCCMSVITMAIFGGVIGF